MNIKSVILASLLITSNCFAQNTLEIKAQSESTKENTSRWNLEGDIQAHSVAGPASPWLGIGGAYRIFEPITLGLRGFVPLSHTVDNATYALQTYIRYRVVHGLNTDLFLEPEYSENFYNFIPFGSFGLSVGALTRVGPGLSVGLMGGIEVAQVVVDSVGLETENGLVLYPKIGFITNLNF
jgi:hypothetical protein